MAAPKKTRGLGKGLDALFGDVEVAVEKKPETIKAKKKTEENQDNITLDENAIAYIDINSIKPNSNQPRKTFDEEKLEELALSIEEHGLIQPIVLRKLGKGYEIVAGERRWRAARKVGIKEIPAIIKELSDEENMLLAIIENMQREDLNPIEEAEGLRQMIDTYGLTQEQVSKSVGKSRPYIANCMRLLKLPEKIINYISEGNLSAGHAKVLAGIGDEDIQLDVAEKTIKGNLSVRQLEQLIKNNKSIKKTAKKVASKNANIIRLEDDLKDVLGTKVNLNQNKSGNKGKIEIEFYSKEELERLIELLKNIKQS